MVTTTVVISAEEVGFDQANAKIAETVKLLTTEMKKAKMAVGDVSASYNAQTQKVKVAVTSLKRFKMEMLSVMFFGMALSRVWKDHTDALAEMFGVTQLHSAAMELFLLPAYEKWAEFLNGISMWIMELPPELGYVAIGFQQVGNALFMIGQAWLGVQGLQGFFKTLKGFSFQNIKDLGTSLLAMGKAGLSAGWAAITGFFGFLIANPLVAAVAAIAAIAIAIASIVSASAPLGEVQVALTEINTSLAIYQDKINEIKGLNDEVFGPQAGAMVNALWNQYDKVTSGMSDAAKGLEEQLKNLVMAERFAPDVALFGGPNKAEVQKAIQETIAQINNLQNATRGLVTDTLGFNVESRHTLDYLTTRMPEFYAELTKSLGFGKSGDEATKQFTQTMSEFARGIGENIRNISLDFVGQLTTSQRKQLEDLAGEAEKFRAAYVAGDIDFETFRTGMEGVQNQFKSLTYLADLMPDWQTQVDELDNKYQNHKITLEEYNTSMQKLMDDYNNSIVSTTSSFRSWDDAMLVTSDQLGIRTSLEVSNTKSLKDGNTALQTSIDKLAIFKSTMSMFEKLPVFGNLFKNIIDKLPHAASGGIVTKPTILLAGEAGPEAIVPLNKGTSYQGNITINVNADIKNTADARTLVDEVLRRLKQQLSSGVMI